ncbi:hypothetical protein KKF29_01245, partial [Patescibacteria group bacterium]|nr:hypothetical protein [Patescibacteria group bacterium]
PSDQEQEPNVELENSGEEPDFYLDTDTGIAKLDERIAALLKSEGKLGKELADVEESGFTEEAKGSAEVAESASIQRIEDQKIKLESEKERLEKVRKFRNNLMIGIGVWTGSAPFMLALDRIGKFTGDEKGGLIFDHDERIKLIHDEARAVHLLSKIAKPFLPGWAKAMLSGGEMVWTATDHINEKYETSLKDGKELSFADSGKWAMEELTSAISLDDLKDHKKIAELGKNIKEFAKNFGGTVGEKLDKIGDFIEKHPDKASGVLVKLFESISKGEAEPDKETNKILEEANLINNLK